MKNYVLIIALISSCAITTMAQSSSPTSSKWMQEVREYKHEMLIEETGMTEEQQELFLPLYTAMEEEIVQVNIVTRQMEMDISNSAEEVGDSLYEVTAFALAELKMREAQIEMDYYSQFEQILSHKQLFLLKRAENRFTSDMLKHNKRSQSQKNR